MIVVYGAIAVCLVVYGLVLFPVFQKWRERRRMWNEAMAGDSCLLCDNTDVESRDEGDYACHACGYDTRIAADPKKSELLNYFRDAKLARAGYKEALVHAEAAANESGWSQNSRNRAAHHAQEAGEKQLEAMTYLRDLGKAFPELVADLDIDMIYMSGSHEAAHMELASYVALLQTIMDRLRAKIIS